MHLVLKKREESMLRSDCSFGEDWDTGKEEFGEDKNFRHKKMVQWVWKYALSIYLSMVNIIDRKAGGEKQPKKWLPSPVFSTLLMIFSEAEITSPYVPLVFL